MKTRSMDKMLILLMALVYCAAVVHCAGNMKKCRGPKRMFRHGTGVDFRNPCVRFECDNGKFKRLNCTDPAPEGPCMNRHRGPWPACCRYFRLC
uniref:Single domain-containing protein n=1 Tax=Amblyomma maculatum TaxID=34609 RepID=G3MTN5_AMBMU